MSRKIDQQLVYEYLTAFATSSCVNANSGWWILLGL